MSLETHIAIVGIAYVLLNWILLKIVVRDAKRFRAIRNYARKQEDQLILPDRKPSPEWEQLVSVIRPWENK